jgi:hypothetical protein
MCGMGLSQNNVQCGGFVKATIHLRVEQKAGRSDPAAMLPGSQMLYFVQSVG